MILFTVWFFVVGFVVVVVVVSYIWQVSWSQAAVTKSPRLGPYTIEMHFSTVLAAGKSKIKAWPPPVSGESSLPDLQTAVFSLWPHRADT